MKAIEDKRRRLKARKFRIRKKIRGTAYEPRVSVYFSNKSIFAQMIDDGSGNTVASFATMGKGAGLKGKGRQAARIAGEGLAEKAMAIGIVKAVFDRNGRRYHGRVKEFADALRAKGIVM